MYAVVQVLISEEKRRKEAYQNNCQLPFNPDHCHQMLNDLEKKTNSGYSAIGRLRELAELKGLELGVIRLDA